MTKFFFNRPTNSCPAILHQGSISERQSKGGSYWKGCRYVYYKTVSLKVSSFSCCIFASYCLLFLLTRTCDRGVPLQASGHRAQSAALTVAPPEHLYPQGIHSLQEWQLIFCHHQTVPSPLRPDGAQPDWLLCLSVCHCPRALKWYFKDRNLKVNKILTKY